VLNQQASIEALCSIFGRANIEVSTLETLLSPLYSRESLELLHEAYKWAGTSPDDEDDQKYTFVKKLSEVPALI
jgi:hypothetical protein